MCTSLIADKTGMKIVQELPTKKSVIFKKILSRLQIQDTASPEAYILNSDPVKETITITGKEHFTL